jgi:GntR family transcriptional regulator
MDVKVDFRSGIPIYIQIMEQIKDRVASGLLQPGDQLPTVRQMATDLRVNFNTVARAYRLLDEAGVISTQHGRGTYILGETQPEAVEHIRRQALQELTRRYLSEARRLEFTPKEVKILFDGYLAVWEAQGLPPAEASDGEDG